MDSDQFSPKPLFFGRTHPYYTPV